MISYFVPVSMRAEDIHSGGGGGKVFLMVCSGSVNRMMLSAVVDHGQLIFQTAGRSEVSLCELGQDNVFEYLGIELNNNAVRSYLLVDSVSVSASRRVYQSRYVRIEEPFVMESGLAYSGRRVRPL
jgi:hypothetical protein